MAKKGMRNPQDKQHSVDYWRKLKYRQRKKKEQEEKEKNDKTPQ